MLDAAVVGSGPNGLSAAITLARAGLDVRVLEANETPGGGLRSEALTLPGFLHDPCAAAFPLGAASPFFRSLPLQRLGVEWAYGQAPLVHLRDDGPAITLYHSLEQTAAALGPAGEAYHRLLAPIVADWPLLLDAFLGPPFRFPRHPLAMLRFARHALRSSAAVASQLGTDPDLRALWAGVAAHIAAPLETPLSASTALFLFGAAHTCGWPVIRGGSGVLSRALTDYLVSLGGEVECGHPVRSLGDLPPARVILFDTSPAQLLAIASDRFTARYRRQLGRYRHGSALFKLDYALSGPVPWRDPQAALAPTVHLGHSYASIAASERAIARGQLPESPLIIAVQPSLFDSSRAPRDSHTLWAYCHVPFASTADMSDLIEARIEAAAPGFRQRVLARAARGPADLARENASFAGGDFSNGAMSGLQTLFRPALRFDPYATPDRSIFLCSAATPPGPGVHGMCGYRAARSVLRSLGVTPAPLPELSRA